MLSSSEKPIVSGWPRWAETCSHKAAESLLVYPDLPTLVNGLVTDREHREVGVHAHAGPLTRQPGRRRLSRHRLYALHARGLAFEAQIPLRTAQATPRVSPGVVWSLLVRRCNPRVNADCDGIARSAGPPAWHQRES